MLQNQRSVELDSSQKGHVLKMMFRMLPWIVVCVSLLIFSVNRYREGLNFERDLRQVRQIEKYAVALYFSGFELKSAVTDSLLLPSQQKQDTEALISESLARLDGQLSVAESQLTSASDMPALPPLRRTFSSLETLCKEISKHHWKGSPSFINQQRQLLRNLLNQWFIEVEALNSMAQLQVIRLDAELGEIQRGNLLMFAAVGMATVLMLLDILRMWNATEKSQAKREEELKQLAHLDPLTGLLNRRGWEPNAIRVVQRCGQKSTPLTVVMLDLDHFKEFNDTYGHAEGDRELRNFGTQLTQRCRPGDIIARIGGEEFAIALPGCNIPTALRLVERIREEISLRTTFSAGLTEIQPEESLEEALHRADLALYEAKRKGRARSVAAGSYAAINADATAGNATSDLKSA
jgi:diguanylate cyclase (GGDEF)-like protein